jgi:Mn2+/Fe2+ NRAMP family transporter
MNFPKFPDLAARLPVISKRPRRGSPADRGKVVPFRTPGGDDAATVPLRKRMVPGIVAGAADLDPAAVMTATVAGASFGLSVAWIVLLCIPILRAVFGVSARIGHETGLGLIRIVRVHFNRKLALGLAAMVAIVNIVMIVADLMAVSDAFSIVLGQPRRFFPALIAFAVWYILTLVGYQKVNQTLSLVALFLFAYVGAAVMATDSVTQTAVQILRPTIAGPGYILGLIAVFGSLLTPDVIVWQTSTKREQQSEGFHDVQSQLGCIIACVVSLSVIIAASHMRIADPAQMTTVDAAQALAPLGELGPILFALGIIGSGLVALPILVVSLCFSISEAAGWEYGLSKPPWEARSFFVLICVVLVAAVVVNYFGINTVQTLYWSQVLAGIFIVPIMFFILWIANDRRIMHSTNTRAQNFWLGAAVGGMLMANLVFFGMELLK